VEFPRAVSKGGEAVGDHGKPFFLRGERAGFDHVAVVRQNKRAWPGFWCVAGKVGAELDRVQPNLKRMFFGACARWGFDGERAGGKEGVVAVFA